MFGANPWAGENLTVLRGAGAFWWQCQVVVSGFCLRTRSNLRKALPSRLIQPAPTGWTGCLLFVFSLLPAVLLRGFFLSKPMSMLFFLCRTFQRAGHVFCWFAQESNLFSFQLNFCYLFSIELVYFRSRGKKWPPFFSLPPKTFSRRRRGLGTGVLFSMSWSNLFLWFSTALCSFLRLFSSYIFLLCRNMQAVCGPF